MGPWPALPAPIRRGSTTIAAAVIGHFAFLAPCSAALAAMVPEICRAPAGFDRAAFHREFNPAVVAFLKAKLPPR